MAVSQARRRILGSVHYPLGRYVYSLYWPWCAHLVLQQMKLMSMNARYPPAWQRCKAASLQ